MNTINRIVFTMLFSLPLTVVAEQTSVEVGKHANVNLDATTMILSLLLVLLLIVASAWLLKKFNMVTTQTSKMKVVATLPLGTKEKVMVVQVGDEQLLLGVSGQQVNLLKTLDKPISQVNDVNLSFQPIFKQKQQKSE
ncbi:flagellar biosynthetic protein FliO [Thalassotalea marina]|uniref:Flagellar protein n=1 Tax=Thalassotalea marina TaxID=1673741 RepID=A0A919BBE8_9GAMM|nr:flagellar biosynthetic protein FliO [Thalassotalea marina]GHF80656.1 hypothetical protein GCM10017161_04960 [Thalassotalea marina]